MAKSFPNTGATVGLAADRTALTSPFAGMQFFETDTKALYLYNGSAWVNMLDTDTPPGIVKLTSGSLSGTTTNIVNCFSATYNNYRLLLTNIEFSGGAADLYFRALVNTTPYAGAGYYWTYRGFNSNSTSADSGAGAQTLGYAGLSSSANTRSHGVYDLFNPFATTVTTIFGSSSGLIIGTGYNVRNGGVSIDTSTSYDGLQLLTNTAPTFTGSYTLYGYN